MTSMRRRGFTLVELIIVIAVIGILATVTVVGLARYQADTRDARREASATVISEALEKYYDQNGEYPSCTTIQQPATTVATSVLSGISEASLLAPNSPSGETNSLKCQTLTISSEDFFEYAGDGSTSCTSGTSTCLQYSLKYKKESTSQIITLEGRHKGSIASSGTPTISIAGNNFDRIDVSWTGVPNATAYRVQSSTSANFATPFYDQVVTGTTNTVTGLTAGTQYFFRVQANGTTTQSDWSNTVNQTTLSLGSPTAAVAVNSSTQLTVTWNAVTNATSYTMERSLSSSFTSPTTTAGLTDAQRTQVQTGLTSGTTYYFRIKALNGSVVGPWSSTVTGVPIVSPPSCTASNLNSNTQYTSSWSAVTGATSYNLQYANNSGFSGPGSVNNIAGTSQAIGGLYNGTTYYTRVQAVNGGVASTWANCPAVATGVSGPVSAGYSYGGCCQVVCIGCVDWVGDNANGYSGNYRASHVDTYGSCEGGAAFEIYMDVWYAYSNGGSANTGAAEGWTNGNRSWWMINGSNSWYGWYNAKVSCVINGQRAGGWSMGTIGGY